MAPSKTDPRRPGVATTIRFADFETKVSRVSWRESEIHRPEIKLPRVDLAAGARRERIEP